MGKKILSFSSLGLNILFYIKFYLIYEKINNNLIFSKYFFEYKNFSDIKNFNIYLETKIENFKNFNYNKNKININNNDFNKIRIYSINDEFNYENKYSEYTNFTNIDFKLNDIIEFIKDDKTLGFIKNRYFSHFLLTFPIQKMQHLL